MFIRHFISAFAIAAALISSASAADSAGQWEVIFDGKSTDKLRGFKRESFPDKGWTLVDGALKAEPKGEVVDLVTKDKYRDFELELEWKVTPGANSGIMYRVSEKFDAPWHTGPEYQLLDDARHADGKSPKTSSASLYALIAPKNPELKPVGEWNKTRIVLQGSKLQHWLNGRKVVECDLASPEVKDLIAKSKFSSLPHFAQEPEGYLCFQHHHDEVYLRNIRVRRLDSK